MRKNENGSVTAIVVVTVLFILMLLGTYLTTISSKRKAQLQETLLLHQAYDGDMKNAYDEQIQKREYSQSKYTDVLYIEATGNQSISGITLPDNYKMIITTSLEEGTNYNIFDYNLSVPKLGINNNKKLELKTVENSSNVNEYNVEFNKKMTITNDNTRK